VAAPAAADGARYRIWMYQALRRLADGGANVRYALDMTLSFTLAGGKAGDALFENVVPDYRRYCAIVRSVDVQLDGPRFVAKAVADVDHGGQGGKRRAYRRREQYTYTLEGLAIGDVLGGRYAGKVGDRHDKGIIFLGSIDRRPPPEADGALAFMRLHGAMQQASPVVLIVSLSEKRPIHGYAWASGYNHQPQTVDASKLKLAGGSIAGDVTVTVVPDCYHDQDVTFDMTYAVAAKVRGHVIEGTFTGHDRGEKTKGVVTGELRRKAPPVATLANLRLCRLALGYCMPAGRRGQTHADVLLEFAGGKLGKARVVRPKGDEPMDAAVTKADLASRGDRLTGAVEFELKSPQPAAGKYRYDVEAIIDGNRLRGYWRGAHNGKPILTKSSKLGGTLTPNE
jgi:hypothetical protein